MEKLKEIVLTSNTRAGCIFDLSIQVLIIISLISFSIDTLPDIDKSLKEFLSTLETFIVIVFTIEYLLRIILTSPSSKYIFSFYGFIDIIAILPFYLSTSVSLQTLRILRLFRIIRIFKLTKYNQAYKRVAKSLSLAKEELILFLLLTLILLYLAAVGIYHFEHAAQPQNFKSIFDALWWAVATLTTVGYGDIYPITVGGKIFTFIMLMLGVGTIAVPTGIIASALSSVRKNEKSS